MNFLTFIFTKQVTTQRNSVTAQIARWFTQEQGESAQFTQSSISKAGFTWVNEHFQRGYWANLAGKLSRYQSF